MTAEEKKKERIEELKEKTAKYYFDVQKKETKTLQEIFKATSEKQKIWVDEPLGCYIEIGHISMKDMSDLMAIKDKNLQGLEMLFRLLKSANPEAKKEEVFGLEITTATAMINAIMREGLGFQRVMNLSKEQQVT